MIHKLTFDIESEPVSRIALQKFHVKSSGLHVWLLYIAHDVDVGFLLHLDLRPDHRVVEQVELVHVELAHQFQRLVAVDHVNLVLHEHLGPW